MKATFSKFTAVLVIGVFLALSARAETAITNQYWICDATNTANLGTLDNPFDGSDQAKFDTIMSNMPPNCAIHILPGTYETWGQVNWQVKSQQKIVGSGVDVAILRLAADVPIVPNGPAVIGSSGSATQVEVSDLTVDANYTGQAESHHGITINGTENAVRRVKVENLGYYPNSSSEAWGIFLSNYYLPKSVGNIIEECEVDPLAGGHFTTAITMGGGANGTCLSGIIRNNRVFLTPDPAGAQIAFGMCGGWQTDCQFEDNYVDGADGGVVSDTGGATNIICAHNILKNVYQGFVFWNYPRRNLTFAFNKIELCPTNSYFSAAFGFSDGTFYTNITIIGNDVGWAGTPQRSAYFLCVSNVVGLTVADNTVDSSLYNYNSASGLKMYNNYDLYRNDLPQLNTPTVGGADVTPIGQALISSAEVSSALTNLGLPGNPALVVTNNETDVTFSNLSVNGVLSVSDPATIEPWLNLNLYTASDYANTAVSAAYIDLSSPQRRLFLGSPSRPITRLNMQNVGIGEDFPSMTINNQAAYTTPTNTSWAFISSDAGQGYLALIANSANGYITGQQSTDPGCTAHRSLAFMTFSDTNDAYHHTAQYVFDTHEKPASWYANQVYWSWRIGGTQVADIEPNASWRLTAPSFSVSGIIAGGGFRGNGNGLTSLNANSITGGLTTNITVTSASPITLCFTNGILRAAH